MCSNIAFATTNVNCSAAAMALLARLQLALLVTTSLLLVTCGGSDTCMKPQPETDAKEEVRLMRETIERLTEKLEMLEGHQVRLTLLC